MIRILTDSTADLTRQDAEALGVRVVPLSINFEESHFLEGVEIDADQFYSMLAECSKLPTTSQPSPEFFIKEFEDAKAAGDDVICILLAGALSGTCQSAEIAKEEADYDKIHIVDSRMVTLGTQLLVRRAVRRVNEGFTVEEILADLEDARSHLRLIAAVDTLKYLHKGGRLSAGVALAGGLLGIKPIIEIDGEGKIAMLGKSRGMPGAYVQLFKLIDQYGGIDCEWPVIVGYTAVEKNAYPIANFVTQHTGASALKMQNIGAVVGTHAGPGACGLAFFSNDPIEEK